MAKPLFNFTLPEPPPAPLSPEIVFNVGAAPARPLTQEGPIKFSIPKPKAPAVPTTETPDDEDYLTAARRYVRANETSGKKYATPYKDSKGYWTVGVGHLIQPGEMKRFKGKTLTDDEIESLFDEDLNKRVKVAKKELGKAFDKFSTDLKVAAIDGFFRGDLSGSPATLRLLREGKYEEAAKEFLDNNEYRASVAKNRAGKPHGVAARMERIAAAMAAEASKQ